MMAKVLIVDDEITTVDMLSKALELIGHEPVPAYGGEHALRRLEEDARAVLGEPDAPDAYLKGAVGCVEGAVAALWPD